MHAKRHINVTALARPEPNLELFAKALIGLAEQMAAREE
jgi:hypothetical protein